MSKSLRIENAEEVFITCEGGSIDSLSVIGARSISVELDSLSSAIKTISNKVSDDLKQLPNKARYVPSYETPPKRKPGRPRKTESETPTKIKKVMNGQLLAVAPKRKPGRPRKQQPVTQSKADIATTYK